MNRRDEFLSDEELARLMVSDQEIEAMMQEAVKTEPLSVVCPDDSVPPDAVYIPWDETLKTLEIEKAPTNIFSRLWATVRGWFS